MTFTDMYECTNPLNKLYCMHANIARHAHHHLAQFSFSIFQSSQLFQIQLIPCFKIKIIHEKSKNSLTFYLYS